MSPIVVTNSSPAGRVKRVKSGAASSAATPFFQEDYIGGVQSVSFSVRDPTSGFYWGSIDSPRKAIVDDPDGSGDKVFRIIGRPSGADAYDNQAYIEHRFGWELANVNELWVEYKMRLGPEWAHRDGPSVDNNKFFLVWNGSYSTRMLAGMEYLRSTSTNIGGSALRAYAKILPTGTATDFESAREPFIGGPNGPITLDTWHTIRFRIKTSTDAYTADGAFQMWVDGTLRYNRPAQTIGDWTTPTVRPQIENGYFLGSSNAGFDVDTNHYFKGWKFYNTDPGW